MSAVRPNLRVIGLRLEPEHHRLRDFLTRAAQPHEWLEAGTLAADALLTERGLDGAPLPIVIDDADAVTGATVE